MMAGGGVPLPVIGRRAALARLGGGVLAAGAGGLLAGCGGARAAAGEPEITIGFITPLTGSRASAASADEWVLRVIRESPAWARGFRAGGKTWRVGVQVRDSESDVNRAAYWVQQLLLSGGVDMILAGGGVETAIPVAQVCENQGIPCVATGVPWDLWYSGLGGDPAAPAMALAYSALFFFGFEQTRECFTPMWRRAGAAREVACLYPFDAVGNAYRSGFEPLIKAAGYTPVDGGAYRDGTTDYRPILARFAAQSPGLFTGAPEPEDFTAFWKQAGQAGFRPKLAAVSEVARYPDDLTPLGPLAAGIAIPAWWGPTVPHRSSLTGQTARELAAAYQAQTGRQWTQSLGSTYSLFEIAREAFTAATDPTDGKEVAAVVRGLSYQGMCGAVDFAGGPTPGVALLEPAGAQWLTSGGPFPYELTVVDNSASRLVPVGADLVPDTL